MKKYRGVFPALYACFDPLGRIDPRGVRNMTRFLCGKGVAGIFVNGKPEGAPPLTVREKIAVTENVMAQAAGQVMVVCRTGCSSVEDTLELTRHAALCGADAAAVPLPREGAAFGEALDHGRRVADCAPDTDMIFCDVPLPGNETEKGLLDAFVRETRTKGVILPANRGGDIAEYRKLFGDGVSLFTTGEADFENTIGRGADAVISYLSALIPEECVRRESDVRFNPSRRGAGEDSVIDRLDKLFLSCESRSAVAREVLRQARGMDCGRARPPEEMTDVDREVAGECVRVLKSAGL